MTPKQRDELETLIDSATLADVVHLLAGVAFDKADHIASNWQDDALAKAWQDASASLSSLASRIERKGI